ncbi:AAA family ATPase [Priestia aryabhattai]|uniref:AAA family ATPase n=1 Tax=Priestia aryabhattai TaxID=412384 RepID=UPI00399F6977
MSVLEIRVRPTKELHFSEESYFGIYGAEVHEDDLESGVRLNRWGNISIKGSMPRLTMKEEYIVKVRLDSGSQYPGSYILESIRQDKPITIEQQKSYLEAILTPTQVNNIFERYSEGEDIIKMIEENQFDYESVKGLGEKSFEKLREKVMSNLDMGEVLAFLNQYKIKYNLISKLVKEYNSPQIVIEKIKSNPYVLTEVKGIGFEKADAIAKAVGYDMESPMRIDSCLWYCIGLENSGGHSWVGFKQLLNKAISFLKIKKEPIIARLNGGAKGILNIDDRYTTEMVYKAEQFVAQKMTQFRTTSKKLFTDEELNTFLNEYCAKNKVELEENQRKFFFDWNENNILFLIGGGGMGKSWLQRILLDLIDTKNLTTALLAPTGKASKVMQGYTGRQASTIHRKAGVFDSDEDANIAIMEDVIIIDESSMCDIFILKKFFEAVSNENARILFVGDDFQLPSVGVGNFLFDSIHSGCMKISRLKKVFRQDDGGILDVATSVRKGRTFLNDDADGRIVFGKDCVFWLAQQQFIEDGIIKNYTNVIKRFNPEDVTILSPTKKGRLGTVSINKRIQEIVNPSTEDKKEKTFGKDDFATTFRVGDLVMNITNTYEMETMSGGKADVFNGDTGKILDINIPGKFMVVDFDDIHVKMKFETVPTNLIHSWATTIHKSQGSQYKVVIVIIDKSMKRQLNANLIYTGFSRPKDYMLTLGQAEAINHGVKIFANMERRSFLQELLQQFGNADEKIENVERNKDHLFLP